MKRIVLSENESNGTKDGSSPPSHEQAQSKELEGHRLVPAEQQQQKRRRELPQILPPEFMEILAPAFTVGAGTGTCGLFTGAAFGIFRSAHPVLFSLYTGLQWFTLGSSYCAARLVTLKAMREDQTQITPWDKTKASALAGGFAGVMGASLRSPKNIAPALFVFSVFGAGGQSIVNAVEARRNASSGVESSAESWITKWNPLQRLTDQDYEKILQERLLRVEAEIAVIDDNIKELYEAEKRTQPAQTNNPNSR